MRRARCNGERGQSTLETAIVFVAFLAIVVGLGAVAKYFTDGDSVDSASENAPYCITESSESRAYVLAF